MVKLVEWYIKTDIINIINTHHMLKKLEESMCIIGREIKDANWISMNKRCNV